MIKKTALIAGSTGLIGNELLQILLEKDEYEKIYALVRRPLEVKHPKLTVVICDFERLEEVRGLFAVDDVYCCLGTTIKKAKTKEAMNKIDVEYPLAIAKLAKEEGAQHFLLISSMNADASSRIFYSRIKGQLEEQLKSISYDRLSILRPSLLLGNRKEHRLGEEIASKMYRGLKFVLGRPIPKLGIEAKAVANAMYKIAQMEGKGVVTYSAEAMNSIAH